MNSYSGVPRGWPALNIATFIKGAIYGGLYGPSCISIALPSHFAPSGPPKMELPAVNNSNAWHPEKFPGIARRETFVVADSPSPSRSLFELTSRRVTRHIASKPYLRLFAREYVNRIPPRAKRVNLLTYSLREFTGKIVNLIFSALQNVQILFR